MSIVEVYDEAVAAFNRNVRRDFLSTDKITPFPDATFLRPEFDLSVSRTLYEEFKKNWPQIERATLSGYKSKKDVYMDLNLTKNAFKMCLVMMRYELMKDAKAACNASSIDCDDAERLIEVHTACSSKQEAVNIGTLALERKLCGSVYISKIKSLNPMSGHVYSSSEFKLTIVTVAERFDELNELIQEAHSYIVPAVYSTAVLEVDAEYADGIRDNSQGRGND